MKFNFFSSQKFECPRCLGKGHVDWSDIYRLKQELRWGPGLCAYCNGKGKVNAEMLANLKPDLSYLTTDIDQSERARLINGDKAAFERAKWGDAQTDHFILQVEYLAFMGKMDAETIADFFMIGMSDDIVSKDKQDIIDYINRVIHRNRKTGS